MIFQTCIGQPAEGENFFQRPRLEQQFWKKLQTGSHLLISAPRRVGKTSFLKNVRHQDFWVKYLITEASNHANEFFKKLYKDLLEELSQNQSLWERLGDIVSRNQIKKVGASGIEIEAKDLNYFEEFKFLLKKVETEKTLVFVIDEFSEALENIILDQGEDAGKAFLHQNRELRQDSEIGKKARFVYSGSIGLGNIAERIGASKSINDLADFDIPAFSLNESQALIQQVTINQEITFNNDEQEYLLDQIYWLMPYYIQVVLDEIENLLIEQDSSVIDQNMIDSAIQNALAKRNYFEHWHTRLRTAFKGAHYSFAKEVLNLTASSGKATTNKLYDLAAKHEIEEIYPSIIRALEYDGYIAMNNKGVYEFNSPLLRIWWKRNITV